MWDKLETKYPVAATLDTDTVSISGSTAQTLLLYYEGLKELEEELNSALSKAEQGLSETTNRNLRVNESFKEAHQWYKNIIVI